LSTVSNKCHLLLHIDSDGVTLCVQKFRLLYSRAKLLYTNMDGKAISGLQV